MGKIVIDVKDNQEDGKKTAENDAASEEKPRRGCAKYFLVFIAILFLAAIGSFGYWQYLKTTPQYTVALLAEASRDGDTEAINNIIDTDKVVDDFMPRVVTQAVAIYGRGLSPAVVERITVIATPFMPGIKKRIKIELPKKLQARAAKFRNVPFPLFVIGAHWYLEINKNGNSADVKSLYPDKPISFKMQYEDGRWKIVAINDDKIATEVAQKFGQEIIGAAKQRGKTSIDNIGNRLGIPNLGELINRQ